MRSADGARWPFGVWAAHLLIPLTLLGYAGLRAAHGATSGWRFWAIGTAGTLWLLVGILVLALPGGRNWLCARRRELLLTFVSLAVAAGLFDLGLTVSGRVPTVDDVFSRYTLHYRSSVFTLGRLEPDQALEVESGPRLDINSRGFRGPEIAIPKPEGTRRAIFLGGSQVFDQSGMNWPVEVGRLITTPDRPVDVINAGIPSHRTTDSLGKCITELWMLQPDVLVVCQAWNDMKYFARLAPEMPYRDVFRPRPNDWRVQPTGLDRLLSASSMYRVARARVIELTIGAEGEAVRPPGETISEWGPGQYRLNLELLCDLAHNLGAEIVLCKQARLPTRDSRDDDRLRTGYDRIGLDHESLVEVFERCDDVVDDVASRKAARVIDMNRALSGRTDLFADHVHFNMAGSHEAARLVANELRELLISTPAARSEP